MFAHPCGEQFEQAVATSADPATVVPNDFVIVHGGTTPIPAAGTVYSGAVGPTLDAAACAVPHGQIRVTTVGEIRDPGGTVIWVIETSRRLTLNRQHVNITEAGPTAFSELMPNPVPRVDRIDGKP